MALPKKKRKAPKVTAPKPAQKRAVTITDPFILGNHFVPNGHVPAFKSAPFTGTLPARELPSGYGDNLIRLQVRDPNYMYAYWEIRAEVEAAALARLGSSRADIRSVLRVYDLTQSRDQKNFFDITLANMAADWTIGVKPNCSYVVELGLLHRDGRFVALARSNEVTTPRDGMSDVLDEEWAGLDSEAVYALSGGFRVGMSSGEMREQMKKRLEGSVTSGSGSGGLLTSPVRAQNRKFWFELDCEVIVYGATEPDAKVTINGQRIQLRPDGTFSLRTAFPDGKITFDARATSADGVEERQIAPTVERGTKRHSKLLTVVEGVGDPSAATRPQDDGGQKRSKKNGVRR